MNKWLHIGNMYNIYEYILAQSGTDPSLLAGLRWLRLIARPVPEECNDLLINMPKLYNWLFITLN